MRKTPLDVGCVRIGGSRAGTRPAATCSPGGRPGRTEPDAHATVPTGAGTLPGTDRFTWVLDQDVLTLQSVN